jgi:electron transport complex protein RnfD
MTAEYLSPPHQHDGSSVSGMMRQVCIALLPGLLCYVWVFGIGVLIQCLLAVTGAMLCEWIMLTLTGKPALHLQDGSVIVTALLFALAIPPGTPWWINLLGCGFAVIFAKHLYGGLGYNLFNPAMAGYAFVLLSYPARMNHWPAAGDGAPAPADYLTLIFSGDLSAIDALSGASPLNHMKSQLDAMAMVPEIIANPIYGAVGGAGWELLNLAFCAGGIWLLFTRVIRWHIPVGVLAGLAGSSLLLYVSDTANHVSPLFHLGTGGIMLGAFFIATDPVTAPSTERGRLLFGLLIGVLVCVIRTWGGYPDGIAFAVLIANMFAPLIGHYTTPRVMGEDRRDALSARD